MAKDIHARVVRRAVVALALLSLLTLSGGSVVAKGLDPGSRSSLARDDFTADQIRWASLDYGVSPETALKYLERDAASRELMPQIRRQAGERLVVVMKTYKEEGYLQVLVTEGPAMTGLEDLLTRSALPVALGYVNAPSEAERASMEQRMSDFLRVAYPHATGGFITHVPENRIEIPVDDRYFTDESEFLDRLAAVVDDPRMQLTITHYDGLQVVGY